MMTKAASRIESSGRSGVRKARPIVPGDRYLVHWRNGEKHLAEVVEKRPLKKTGDPEESTTQLSQKNEFYVHYVSFDRRLDEWVTEDRVDVATPVDVGMEDNADDSKNKRNKRKYHEIADSKETMAAALEKEHEEITRVKNIQYIELGQYEIETWYFSPYPGDIHISCLKICSNLAMNF